MQARAVVEQFCRLEAQGAGLDGDSPTSQALWALTTDDWGGVDATRTLVSGFKVDSVRRKDGKVLVRVVYRVVGSMDAGFAVHPRDEESAHVYEVTPTKAGWRIAARTVEFSGHLSPMALLRHFEENLLPPCRADATTLDRERGWCEQIVASIAQLKALAKRLETTGKRH